MPAPIGRFRKDKGKPGKRDSNRPLFIVEWRGYKTACWMWARYVGPHGYGQLSRMDKTINAHVWTWTMTNGPVPKGLELDHLCRNRSCVRPDHMEAVTRLVNSRRGAKVKANGLTAWRPCK